MLEIKCMGTAYEIGVTHGVAAKGKIASAIRFYSRVFQNSCLLNMARSHARSCEIGTCCCLNALKCRGVDLSILPIHFTLRRVLESPSRAAAVAAIKEIDVAGSGHILIADAIGSSGLECTRKWVREIVMDNARRVYHTNHVVFDATDAEESPVRLARIRELASCVAES
ncbi:hypothetical protein GGS21DRAFT_370647 [Xylaria nigripes]|nr:hypothetical protein GGS21DRAFT_370647 [Xylaria nigripes]